MSSYLRLDAFGKRNIAILLNRVEEMGCFGLWRMHREQQQSPSASTANPSLAANFGHGSVCAGPPRAVVYSSANSSHAPSRIQASRGSRVGVIAWWTVHRRRWLREFLAASLAMDRWCQSEGNRVGPRRPAWLRTARSQLWSQAS